MFRKQVIFNINLKYIFIYLSLHNIQEYAIFCQGYIFFLAAKIYIFINCIIQYTGCLSKTS